MPNSAELDPLTRDLLQRYGTLEAGDLLRVMLREIFPGKIALVSSFGAESALLLALAAEIDPGIPVIFLETQKHFPETLEYRDALIEKLGLTDVRSVHPEEEAIKAADPNGDLWSARPDTCCYLRKVLPLELALTGFTAWVNGRKRAHGGQRASLPSIEHDGRRVKVNPLAFWSAERIDAEWTRRGLPEHPLVQWGYTSIGCMPCTAKPKPGEGARSGRWAQFDKQECGIHTPDRKWEKYDTGL